MSGRELIRERVRAGLADMAKLSRAAGRNPAYIQQFISRGVPVELPEKVRIALAPILNVHPDALRESDAPTPVRFTHDSDVQPAHAIQAPSPRVQPPSGQVEVLGVVSAGNDGQFEVNLSDRPLEYIDLPQSLSGVPDLFALFVAGDSMAGIWMPGDVVYVSRRRPLTAGCYVVVVVDTGEGNPPKAFLKQLISMDNEKLRLRQYNPDMTLEIDRRLVRNAWRALHWREWAA